MLAVSRAFAEFPLANVKLFIVVKASAVAMSQVLMPLSMVLIVTALLLVSTVVCPESTSAVQSQFAFISVAIMVVDHNL